MKAYGKESIQEMRGDRDKRALEVECVKYGNDKEGADVIKAMRDM